jgi:hypothetical protein
MRSPLPAFALILLPVPLFWLVGCEATLVPPSLAPTLSSLSITPTDPVLRIGDTLQLAAAGTYSDKTTKDMTTVVAWSSSKSAVATVDRSGLLTAKSPGAATISATNGDAEGSIVVQVSASALQSIRITPENSAIPLGATQQFRASGIYSDGTIQDLTSLVSWSAGTPQIATLGPGGIATATGPGSTAVTAEDGVIVGTTDLTVRSLPASVLLAASFPGTDCGQRINAAEAALGNLPGTIQVSSECGTSVWSPVVILNPHHTLQFMSSDEFIVSTITLAAPYDSMVGPGYIAQIGGVDENTVILASTYWLVEGMTIDGSASQPSHQGGRDDTVHITGSYGTFRSNVITESQGDGVLIVGTPAGGYNNNIVDNTIRNCNQGTYTSCIVVGNGAVVTPGSYANYNVVSHNVVDGGGSGGDCIFFTASLGSLPLRDGDEVSWDSAEDNSLSNCGDSSIELGEGTSHASAIGNHIDGFKNPGILVRDSSDDVVVGNIIYMEPTATSDAIAVSAQHLPESWNNNVTIAGNTISGFLPRSGIYADQAGVTASGNYISDTGRVVAPDGSGLIGRGIICPPTSCLVSNNRIADVLVGIDLNWGAEAQNSTNVTISNNEITAVGTAVSIYRTTCSACHIDYNTFAQVLTVAIDDSSASGSGTSTAVDNTYLMAGWLGAHPVENYEGLPGFSTGSS